MKARTKSNKKRKSQKPSLTTLGQLGELQEAKLPDPPLSIEDPPHILPGITGHEIVEFSRALHVFRIARADFEAKRAALTMKLLRCCHCEAEDYFARLDDQGNIVIEDRTSLEVGTGRPVLDCDFVPSGGGA
jgi:hypothetical protein